MGSSMALRTAQSGTEGGQMQFAMDDGVRGMALKAGHHAFFVQWPTDCAYEAGRMKVVVAQGDIEALFGVVADQTRIPLPGINQQPRLSRSAHSP